MKWRIRLYLKNIEVQGFKSFANKIVFQFHNGITGIVGPNGSGKSNVGDAVRWVLGEQSAKQLRGASMQDVIFQGTQNRKPLSYAYVAITLDNEDHKLGIAYDEVTVARKVYRSGESEYLINGTTCRLKDVMELFYDTGIGKEGYSIIGQGQIDKILSGRPEERRELFDEAAGIVKFKRRRVTAQKKLESEKENLVRVNDILRELEKQIAPLSRQSEAAKEYLKRKEELKELDVNMFLLEEEDIAKELKGIQEKYGITSYDLGETLKTYEWIKEEFEKSQKEMERLERELEVRRQELSNASVRKEKLEGEINVLKEQFHGAEERKGQLKDRIQSLKEELSEYAKEREKQREERNDSEEKLGQIIREGEEAKRDLQVLQQKIHTFNNKIEYGKSEIIETLNERASIKTKISRYDTMLEQISIRKAELNSRLLKAKTEETKQEEELIELNKSLEETKEGIQETKRRIVLAEAEAREKEQNLEKKDKIFTDMQLAYHQQKSKLDSMKNMAERYDGYGNSIKKVMEMRETYPGLIGVVADIMKVEKKYETAIETALGGNIQNIVTEDEETAKKAIEQLKKNKWGRATFLPLKSVKARSPYQKEKVLKEEGVIGTADTLVEAKEKYQSLLGYLLGACIVVKHIDHGIALSKKYGYSLRIVTLEGENFIPGGAISGGAFKNASNLLGRKREIEETKKRVKEMFLSMDKLLLEMKKDKEEREKILGELEEKKKELQEQYLLHNTAFHNVTKTNEKLKEAKEAFQELQKEKEELKRQGEEIEENKTEMKEELRQSEEQEQKMESQVQEWDTQMEDWKGKEEKKREQVSSLEIEIAALRQKREFQKQNEDRVEHGRKKLEKEERELIQSIENLSMEQSKRTKKILEMEEEVEKTALFCSEGEGELKGKIQGREECQIKQKEFFQQREELADRKASLEKEAFRLNSQRERLEETSENNRNYMWEEYEITFHKAVEMGKKELTDLSQIKKEILTVKEAIKKLGDVNVNAIEDYKDLLERYEFLKGQRDDLVAAEEALRNIIDELDKEMRLQFQEKFKEIQWEFDQVFKELFGGGKGTLELMEEEDILEAGIRITAQPPGKKLQNMMQLSGGEKALAAIALLFAIQNLKPSPFCLLDEIEAALDESNVGRFAKYLHKLTTHTQFIVITHRRGTMEKADRLYGITMQEKGVSTLVSVDFIDKELEN